MGDRDGQDRDARDRRASTPSDQVPAPDACALRRICQAGERRRAPRTAERRRCTRGRRLARSRLARSHLPRSSRSNVSRPLVTLVILDGWGLAPPGPGNAVDLASTPVFDALALRYPHTEL